jgi:hypothetical protein
MYGETGYLLVLSVETLELPMEDGCMMSLSRPLVTHSPTSVSTSGLKTWNDADLQVTTLPSASCTQLVPVNPLRPIFRYDAHRSLTSF